MELNLKKLAEKIHAYARLNGFYDNASDANFVTHQTFEIIKEIGEMHEAYKKGRFAAELNLKETIESFEADIKDTFEDEMADVVIRMLDYMRCYEFEIAQPTIFPPGEVLIDGHYWLSRECFIMIRALRDIEEVFFMDIINNIYTIAHLFNVDLDKHIQAKMAYNATRKSMRL